MHSRARLSLSSLSRMWASRTAPAFLSWQGPHCDAALSRKPVYPQKTAAVFRDAVFHAYFWKESWICQIVTWQLWKVKQLKYFWWNVCWVCRWALSRCVWQTLMTIPMAIRQCPVLPFRPSSSFCSSLNSLTIQPMTALRSGRCASRRHRRARTHSRALCCALAYNRSLSKASS